MVDTWSKSDDGLLYTFTLRPGLKFHDLTPVTSRDVVATLRRLLVRDTQNQILAEPGGGDRTRRTNAASRCG